MKIAFLGHVRFSETTLRSVLEQPRAEVVGVVTRSASPGNADFACLAGTAEEAGVPVLLEDRDPGSMAEFLRSIRPDVLYCFGWSSILGPEILEIPPNGCIGYHPAALPRNRGRHPIVWALALGLDRTASTFFLMDELPDHGDIVSQREVPIAADDDAASLYARLERAALEQIPEFTGALAAGELEPEPQDHSRANVWRKRGFADGQIDWRMSTRAIRDLVRALTRPYVGAHCMVGGEPVKVWRVEAGPEAPPNLEPGKVLESGERVLVVKTGDGSIRVLEHEIDPLPERGSYL